MSEDQKGPLRLRRWIGGFFVLAVIGVVSVYWFTRLTAERQLRSRIVQLQKAGEPILPNDFMPSAPFGFDNGGQDISAAAPLLKTESDAWKSFDQMLPQLPLKERERQIIEKVVEESSAALDRMELAKTRSRFEWDLNLKSPVLMNASDSRQFNAIRSLANVLGAAAFLDHERGNDAAALTKLDRVLLIARYADHHPSLIGHLVGIGCSVMAVQHLNELTSDLKIGTDTVDVSPEQARRLVDLLLDEPPLQEGLIRGLRYERMEQLDAIQCMVNGVPLSSGAGSPSGTKSAVPGYFDKPLLYSNANVMLDHMAALIQAASEKNWPSAKAKFPVLSPGNSPYFVDLILPGIERAFDAHFQGIADRRLAAVVLAIRWYAVEHGGRLPPSLDALVPQYLASLPLDPLARADQPLRYLPDRPDDPLVYSVGPNGVDDGGSETSLDPKRRNASEWERQDRVVHLRRQPRPPPEPDDDDAAKQPLQTQVSPTTR